MRFDLIFLIIAILAVLEVSAFKPIALRRIGSRLAAAKIDIHTRDVELSDPLKERVNEKIGKVIDKLGYNGVTNANVVLRVLKFKADEAHSTTTKKDSQIAEVTVTMKGGSVIRTSEGTEDMYASIDLVSHKLAKQMKRNKDKVQEKRQNKKVGGDVAEDEEPVVFNEEELLLDLDSKYKSIAKERSPEAIDLTSIRQKVFKMPPITVQEAINSLEYIDHPFFVFRNKDTNEVNVVYKRKDGGVGHILPEK
jgi:putative sigma-54 modulation protein